MKLSWRKEFVDGLWTWKSGAYKITRWTADDRGNKVRQYTAMFTGSAGYPPERLNDRPLLDLDHAKRLCGDHLDLMRVRLDKIQ